MIKYVLLLGLLLPACTKDPKDYPNLKIEDVKKGKGTAVGGFDTIYVYYEGRFEDGKVFDTNRGKKKPTRYSMRAKTLIEGWRIGLVGMKEGGKRRLTIPPELAFGKKGKMGRIPPGATLVFDVELVRVE